MVDVIMSCTPHAKVKHLSNDLASYTNVHGATRGNPHR